MKILYNINDTKISYLFIYNRFNFLIALVYVNNGISINIKPIYLHIIEFFIFVYPCILFTDSN